MTDSAGGHATPGLSLAFRPIPPEDREFLYTVYASTRTDELAVVDWPQAQKDAFLRDQFNAQHRAYQETYQGSDFFVILMNDRPSGRLYVARWDTEIRIIDRPSPTFARQSSCATWHSERPAKGAGARLATGRSVPPHLADPEGAEEHEA